jgi:hypothetical protein
MLTAWVVVYVRDPTGTQSSSSLKSMLQNSTLAGDSYNTVVETANDALCSLYDPIPFKSVTATATVTCGFCSTNSLSCCECQDTECLVTFERCPTQNDGPKFFSNAPSDGLYFNLLDEQGRAYSEGQIQVSSSTRTSEGYLALSPVYVVIAIGVVAALVVGSIVGIVIYRRRYTAESDFTQESQETGWVAGKKTSLDGRTRANGILN